MCGLTVAFQERGSLRINSNFIKHLKNEHPLKFYTFKSKKEKKINTGRKYSFSRDILYFIFEIVSLLSIVEGRSFKRLFPAKSIPSRLTFTRPLSESQSKYIEKPFNDL